MSLTGQRNQKEVGERMKWTNKGHELDSAGEQLCRLFHDKEKKLYIFGAGSNGR